MPLYLRSLAFKVVFDDFTGRGKTTGESANINVYNVCHMATRCRHGDENIILPAEITEAYYEAS